MTDANVPLYAFNRGIISKRALARTDLKRNALSAEIQRNWMSAVLGPMGLRVGTAYVDTTYAQDYAIHVPFIFSRSDTAIIELNEHSLMRVRIDETILSRPSVATAITNPNFSADVTGWTDSDDAGCTSIWVSNGGSGCLSLVGTKTGWARRRQQISVPVADRGKEHCLDIVILRGPVTLKVGYSSGSDEYLFYTDLGTGEHSLTFDHDGGAVDFWIELSASRQYAALVDSINISTGNMQIAIPWDDTNLSLIRGEQSGDVIFIGVDGTAQYKIERRKAHSWALVKYQPEDGPFRLDNTGPITLTPSALNGDITLTASDALFDDGHVDALFRITSTGQIVTAALVAANTFTDPIRITGVGATQRTFKITTTGVWVGTLTLQQSVGDTSSWVDVANYTTNQTINYNDKLDNQIIYYRIGFKTAKYTSGTATCTLTTTSGSLTGIVRITAVASNVSASAAVITDLGGLLPTDQWAEGQWSTYRGFPTSIGFFEGRLGWSGRDKFNGSISDAFSSFDDTVVGDSGPISRSIGSGPVEKIHWMLALQRLVLGGESGEHSVRSSSLDEPLTPTNFNIKTPSTQGSAAVAALKVDNAGLFVDAGGTKLFQLAMENPYMSYDYTAMNLSELAPEVTQPSIVRMAVQRRPDTRIHCVLSDGTVAVLLLNPLEEVKCWLKIDTTSVLDGDNDAVVDVFMMPGGIEDKVYYTVERSASHCLERWALESECIGGTLSKNLDSHIVYSGSPTTSLTGLPVSHLNADKVAVWGDGKDLGLFTPADPLVLPVAVSNAVVGLPYTAQWKGSKLAYAAQAGTALTQRKRVPTLGLILQNTHAQGLKYGPDFDHLQDLPMIVKGALIDQDSVWENVDMDPIEFPGEYDTDSRICLQAQGPKPCTVLAAVIGIDLNEHSTSRAG